MSALKICFGTAVKYYEAAALYHYPAHRYCIITPNAEWIPPVPSQDGYTNSHLVLQLYADGSFGPHDYSTQPQIWDPARPHLPWIPRTPAAVGRAHGLEVLWRPLTHDDYTPLQPNSPYYRITDMFEGQLQQALEPLKRLRERTCAAESTEETRRIINACDLARHSVIHVRFTDGHTLPALVDLVKGAKRQILECLGYLLRERYIRRVRDARDQAPDTDLATGIYETVGVFTYSLDVTREHVKMFIPVWRIVEVARLPPDFRIHSRIPLRRTTYPNGPTRLIAHVYGGEPYIGKLVVANPSQGLYVSIPGTGMFRFAGSVNTTGEITSVVREDGPQVEHQERGMAPRRATTNGGPDRTYPGMVFARTGHNVTAYAHFSNSCSARSRGGGIACSRR